MIVNGHLSSVPRELALRQVDLRGTVGCVELLAAGKARGPRSVQRGAGRVSWD